MIGVAEIRSKVAEFYGLSLRDMLSPRRDRRIAWPRQVAMALARELTGQSLPYIGMQFGRDHTTVLHAIHAVNRRRDEFQEHRENWDVLVLELEGETESWRSRLARELLACQAIGQFCTALRGDDGKENDSRSE